MTTPECIYYDNPDQFSPKSPAETVTLTFNFSSVLEQNEFILNISGAPSIEVVSGTDPNVSLTFVGPPVINVSGTSVQQEITGGLTGVNYRVSMPISTTANPSRILVCSGVLAVISTEDLWDITQGSDENLQTLIGTMEAGQSASGHTSFLMPPGYDPSGAFITWSLIDTNGTVYSSGQAFQITVETPITGVKISGSAVVNAPSDMQPTLAGQAYQVRWGLTVNNVTTYAFESVEITAPYTFPQGPEDTVELEGSSIAVQVIFDKQFDTVTCAIYSQNTQLSGNIPVTNCRRVPDGWLFSTVLIGLPLTAQLEDYQIVWTGCYAAYPDYRERLVGRVHVVNASILSASADLRLAVNKAHTTISNSPDLLFTEPLLLSYLRSGRDYFNGAGMGMLTSFTMLNAQGTIREYWIRCSAVSALRAQYLAEGEKAFNFGGQSITLDVDRTQYYQGLMDNLKQELDAELKLYKQNLIKKGYLGGDGNFNPAAGLAQQFGAAGAVGINVTPATGWSKYGARWGIRR